MSLDPGNQFNEAGTSAADFNVQNQVLPNSPVLSNDVNAIAERAYRRTRYLEENKVYIDGDTMTDTLTVNASTTNAAAVVGTGDGNGAGGQFEGGATGPGVIGLAGSGSNDPGGQFVGDGTGAGVTGQGGASGPGGTFTSGAGAAGEAVRAIGYVHVTGTQPAATADPGDNNILHATNITKAWGTVSLTGGAPYAVQDAYNVTNVTEPIANIYRINFVRPLSNATYAITFTAHSPSTGVSISTKNAAWCEFNVWDTTTGAPDTNETVDFIVVGRQ